MMNGKHTVIHLQVKLPEGTLARWGHSATAITLCPGLVEVVVFGGTTKEVYIGKQRTVIPRIAETAIFTFGESATVSS